MAKFSCKACGLKRQPFHLPPRRDGEAAPDHARRVSEAVGVAHALRSPDCDSPVVDLFLPRRRNAGEHDFLDHPPQE